MFSRPAIALAFLSVLLCGNLQASGWQIETVDASGIGFSSSMKMDKDGNAHVCYVLGSGIELKYAFWDHSLKRWFTQVIDQTPNACSLALDSKQHPHISYADAGTGYGERLRYAHWDGTAWKTQALPINAQIITSYSSIALDASDHPSISFYEYRGPKGTDLKIRLRNALWNGKYWEVRTIDGDEGSGKVNDMASDSQGHLHVAYAQVSMGEMRYAYWDGKGWHLETVEGREQNHQQYVGLACGITVDKEGSPHVVYENASAMEVMYAARVNGNWQSELVDHISAVTEDFDRSSIAIDEQEHPYVGYFDGGQGVLKVAHKEGSKWVSEVVDSQGAGFTNSMQIDRGVLWISYSDQSNGSFKVARKELGIPAAVAPPPTGTSLPSDQNVAGIAVQ